MMRCFTTISYYLYVVFVSGGKSSIAITCIVGEYWLYIVVLVHVRVQLIIVICSATTNCTTQ